MSALTPSFSEPKARQSPEGAQEYEIKVSGSSSQLFQDWLQQTDDDQLFEYFSSVLEGIAARNLDHYHLKVNNGRFNAKLGAQKPEWGILIFYGAAEDSKDGPLQVSRCMSCDLDCPLIVGVLGEAPAATAAAAAAALASKAAANAAGAAPTSGLGQSAAEHDKQPQPVSTVAPTVREAVDHAPGDNASADAPPAAAAATGLPDAPNQQQEEEQEQQQGNQGEAGQPQPEQQQDKSPEQQQQQQQQEVGPVSRDSLIKETDHCRVWWDAKARPMWIVTPKQHVERLADLSRVQLVDLFRSAAAIAPDMGCSTFNHLMINHGDNRNHAHLHLKVRVHDQEFDAACAKLPPQHKAQHELLQRFRDQLPPEARGTREAYLLKQQKGRKQPGQGQRQQGGPAWKQQRRGRGRGGQYGGGAGGRWQQQGYGQQQQGGYYQQQLQYPQQQLPQYQQQQQPPQWQYQQQQQPLQYQQQQPPPPPQYPQQQWQLQQPQLLQSGQQWQFNQQWQGPTNWFPYGGQ